MTSETKSKVIAALKLLVTFAGTFLIGKAFHGVVFTTETVDTVGGAILTLVGLAWSIFDNSATIEVIESSLRAVLIGGGGFLVSAGIIPAATLAALIGLLPVLIALVLSFTSKTKVVQMQKGELEGKVSDKTGELTGKVMKVSKPAA